MAVELLDFFSMEKETNTSADAIANVPSHSYRSPSRQRSFNGIQSVISKINPQLLKSVIASSTTADAPPRVDHDGLPSLPVCASVHRPSDGGESNVETAPLTIFYNGTVMVFDVPPHKAEGILKLAVSGNGSGLINRPETATVVSPGDHLKLLGTLTGDLPMARMISLQRFLEKRKERLTSVAPYYCNNKTK